MTELLTEVGFLEERQTAEFKAQKLKVEKQYAQSRAISHNSNINIAYNPVNNRNIESGMMPTRKGIMPKKFEAHQQNM